MVVVVAVSAVRLMRTRRVEEVTVVLDERGVAGDVAGRTREDEAAVGVEVDEVRRAAGEHGEVVRDHDHAETARALETFDQVEGRLFGHSVHRAGGLIQHQKPRLAGERPRHQHALLLALAQRHELALGEGQRIGLTQGLFDLGARPQWTQRVQKRPAPVQATPHDVHASHGDTQVEPEPLRYIADAAHAETLEAAVDAGRQVEQRSEQRRLAAAVAPDDRPHLTHPDLEGERRQERATGIADPKRFGAKQRGL